MKKYIIAILLIIALVAGAYALDYYQIVDIPYIGNQSEKPITRDADITVKVFVQNAESGEYEQADNVYVTTTLNAPYEYTPTAKVNYDVDQERSTLSTNEATDQTVLTVYYVCQTCEITFSGGANASLISGEQSLTVRKGQTPTAPEYYWQGYEIVGYTPELQKVYDDTLFTAVWQEKEYTLTLNLVSGATLENVNGEYEQAYGSDSYIKTFTFFTTTFDLPAVQMDGYTFNGWFTQPNAEGEEYTQIELGTEENITLYSAFDIITYEMKFIAPSGYSFASVVAPAGAEVYAPKVPPEKQQVGEGLNWYTDSSFTELYTFTVMPEEGITLYGKWESDVGTGIFGEELTDNSIDSERELVLYLDYVSYNYLTQSQSTAMDVTFASKSQVESKIRSHMGIMEYPVTFPFSYIITQKTLSTCTIKAFIDDDTMQKECSISTDYTSVTPYAYIDYNYTGRGDYNSFYIDGITKTVEGVKTSNQLIYVVEHGYKPVCESGSAAESMYNKAKKVLNSIIGKDFTDYQKAVAIFDYLCMEVQYDINAFNIVETEKRTNPDESSWPLYDAFYLEGVFNNKKAVCDGISKAYSLMCNIEGIPCVQVAGNSHAWCKVKINNRWTIVDPTHGNTQISEQNKSLLSHEHFMMTEQEKANLGYSSVLYANIKADYSVNYFEVKKFKLGNQEYNCVAKNASEIKNILDYYNVIPASGWVLIDFYYTGTDFANEVKTALQSAGYVGSYMPVYDVNSKVAKLLLEY